MPDLNDFHTFESTKDKSNGLGCSNPVFIWIIVIGVVIYIIGKISGN